MITARKVVLGMVIIATASLFAGCAGRTALIESPKAAAPVSIRVAAAQLGDVVQARQVSGKIVAGAEVVVSAKMGGRIKFAPLQVGQRVEQGAALVTLESQELAVQVEQAEAAVAQAEIHSRNAATSLQRMQTLLNEGAVSRQQFDMTKAEADVAEAQLKQARVAVTAASQAMDNTTVLAPISGLVSGLEADPGEVVAPGQPLFSIYNIDVVNAEISVGENEIDNLKLGDKVKVTVAAVDSQAYTGKIVTMDPSAVNSSRTFLVRAELVNPGHRLKPGMFAEVSLVTGKSSRVVTIPVEAVADQGGQWQVFLNEGGVARERLVKVGLSDGKITEVTSGLKAGEQVITAGRNMVVGGVPVAVQP